MNSVSKKLGDALTQLKQLQDQGIVAIQSKMLDRSSRELLTKHGFIQEVIRGWYIPASPDEQPGDSTAWYASFWDFCTAYFNERLGSQWCLSPDQSLQLHIGDKTVPKQLLVRAPSGRNKPTRLLHDTSVLDIRVSLPAAHCLIQQDGLTLYTLAAALIHCSPSSFTNYPLQMRTVLSMFTDASDLLTLLLEGGHSTLAGRLAGAFRNIGRNLIAENIIKGMDAAGYSTKETDPFTEKPNISFDRRDVSPYINRIQLMWANMRIDVMQHFPLPATNTHNIETYLQQVDNKFVTDAYHSLSIEGYRVSPELIELVNSGQRLPAKQYLDVMAAKGYWDAHQQVKAAIRQVLDGQNAGEVLESTHSDWYLALFSPSVAAGIIKPTDLAGYRTGQVYIRQSKHTPPDRNAIREMMPTLFDLLIAEENPAVRAVLGHFMFVYIHPYVDGNGRMGRFIMNLMLASGGYPWTVIPVDKRQHYMQALETASVDHNIVPFTQFLKTSVTY